MNKLIMLVVIFGLQGCAVSIVTGAVSYGLTGKGVGDHIGSAVTGGDCNVVVNTYNGLYVCEMPVVYNRAGL